MSHHHINEELTVDVTKVGKTSTVSLSSVLIVLESGKINGTIVDSGTSPDKATSVPNNDNNSFPLDE